MDGMHNRRRATARRAVRSGFTLIELLLVLVILSVLAAVVVPKFARRSQQARITAAGAEISSLELGLDVFEVDTGRYPTTEEGLAALIDEPADVNDWGGPYLKGEEVPIDPWGAEYIYKCPGDHNKDGYDIHSKGPDGQDGGDDDITNWSRR